MLFDTNRRRSSDIADVPFLQEIKREDTDIQTVRGESNAQESVIDNVVHVLRGESWFGMAAFYVANAPGAFSMKLPAILLIMAVLSRTVGLGVLSPARAILKAVWISARIFFYYVADTGGALDVW